MTGFTYTEQGRTERPYPQPLEGNWPEGYRLVRRDVALAAKDPARAFAALSNGILSWQLHRLAGLRVSADAPRAAVGVTVSPGFGVGRLRLGAPCRVIWAREIQDDDGGDPVLGQRAGFGYGTLAGHPARGEEGFYAELTSQGQLLFRVAAYSVPSTLAYRLGAPVARLAQDYVTERYLKAARELAV